MRFVFCAASRITKKTGSLIQTLCLTLEVEQKEYVSFFYILKVPSEWLHINGEGTHTRVGGEGREKGNIMQLKKEISICS